MSAESSTADDHEPIVVLDDDDAQLGASVLTFVEHDRSTETMVFDIGSLRMSIAAHDGGSPLRSVVLRANSQTTRDRIVLDEAAQRLRFARNAARKLNLTVEHLTACLAALPEAMRAQRDSEDSADRIVVAGSERAAAEALLATPNLLDRLFRDVAQIGWVGDERAHGVLLLAAVSRLLPQPLWVAYRANGGAAPWTSIALIAELCPPDEAIACRRLTEAMIAHGDRAALRHRLLVVDRAEDLRPETATQLRILHERGGIGLTTIGSALLGEARGPVAVIAATAGTIDRRCRDCFVTVPVDESSEQTARILSEQRWRCQVGELSTTTRAAIVARHHALHRLLERRPVIVPFAERIVFPAVRVRDRQEQSHFLRLIQASALLHQRQRDRQGDAIIASEADFAVALQYAGSLLGTSAQGLSDGTRDLIAALFRAGLATFTMADLPGILPDATRWTYRAALQELLDFGYIESPRAGRGRLRSYRLAARADGACRPIGIHLRPVDSHTESTDVGELAAGGAMPMSAASREEDTRCVELASWRRTSPTRKMA